MAIREDMFGDLPDIGDTIIWNPVGYKGLIHGTCVGFAKSGLPEVEIEERQGFYYGQTTKNGYYTPKTGFVVRKKLMSL